MGDNRMWRGNLSDRHQFLQVNLVRTAENAVRVVDYGDSLGLCTACECVRVMVHIGRFADKECIEFADAVVIFFGDELDEDKMNKTIDGLLDDNKDLVEKGEWGELIGMLNKSFAPDQNKE